MHRDATVDLHSLQTDFSAGSNKDFTSTPWHAPVIMEANAGLIVRALNQSDGVTSTFDMKIMYEIEGGV